MHVCNLEKEIAMARFASFTSSADKGHGVQHSPQLLLTSTAHTVTCCRFVNSKLVRCMNLKDKVNSATSKDELLKWNITWSEHLIPDGLKKEGGRGGEVLMRHPDHMGTGTPLTPGRADCVILKCFRLRPDGCVKRDHTRRQTHTRTLAGVYGCFAQIIHASQMPRRNAVLNMCIKNGHCSHFCAVFPGRFNARRQTYNISLDIK